MVNGEVAAGLKGIFSSIYRPSMVTKTCIFRAISVHPHAPPPAGIFFKLIFVANFFIISNSGRIIPTLTILLHLLPNLSAGNGNEDVPIRDYFGGSHALHLLPADI